MTSASVATSARYSSGLGTLAITALGAAGSMMGLIWVVYWLDPVSGTKVGCAAAGPAQAVEACIASKANMLLIQLGAVGLPGIILLSIGILMILKRPSSH